jgi:hypothetical protein
MMPVAGLPVIDIRAAQWAGLQYGPDYFVRVTQVGGVTKAAVFRWWTGNYPYDLPQGRDVRCAVPVEGPKTCIMSIPLETPHDWKPFIQTIRAAKTCTEHQATHAVELRIQLFERTAVSSYRALTLCEAASKELLEGLHKVAERVLQLRR